MKKAPQLQMDIFNRDPQQDLFQRRSAQPGLELFADTLKGAADKLKSEVAAVKAVASKPAAPKSETRASKPVRSKPAAPAAPAGPFAVIYSAYNGVLRAKPNPFQYSPVLSAELERCSARIWDTGYATLPEAQQAAEAVGRKINDERSKYVRVYDESTGEVVRPKGAARQEKLPKLERGKVPAFQGPERWEKKLDGDEVAWVDVLPDANDSRRRIVRNDIGEIYREDRHENDERRQRLQGSGYRLVKASALTGHHGRGGDTTEDAIIEAARVLEKRRLGAVPLAALRERLGMARKTVDSALIDMANHGRINLSSIDDPTEISPEDEVAAVWVGVHRWHWMFLNE